MMIRVMPIAPMATITVCERTMRRLLGERNREGVSINSEKMPITRQTNKRADAIQPHDLHG